MLIIGFYSNQLGERGTEIGLFDYANYNEKILNNKSIIISYKIEDQNVYNKFLNRFDIVEIIPHKNSSELDKIVSKYNINIIFFEKNGLIENIEPTLCKSIIHCIFNPSQPHGNVFTIIGNTINKIYKTNFPVLPYIVEVDNNNSNFRKILNIPDNAIVFGRYGGFDSFDIHFVKELINNWNKNNTFFLFMNTQKFTNSKFCIFLNKNINPKIKRAFINTCDALLHARKRGETFGFTVAEFALCNKPIITFFYSIEREHIDILGDKAILYKNYLHLKYILENFNKNNYIHLYTNNPYLDFSPHNVMNLFDKYIKLALIS